MAGLSIEIDDSEVQRALAGTKKSVKAIQKGVLRIVGQQVVKALRGAIRASGLHRVTGELLKCYRYKVRKDGSQVNIFPKGASGSHIFPKVYTLNYGHKRHRPYSFIEKGYDAANGNSYDDAMQKFVDKELKKYWG